MATIAIAQTQPPKLNDSAALVLVLASAAGRWRDEARLATLQSNLMRVELERERSLRIEYEARIAELRTAVEIDDVTHVATRVAFDQRFNDECSRAPSRGRAGRRSDCSISMRSKR